MLALIQFSPTQKCVIPEASSPSPLVCFSLSLPLSRSGSTRASLCSPGFSCWDYRLTFLFIIFCAHTYNVRCLSLKNLSLNRCGGTCLESQHWGLEDCGLETSLDYPVRCCLTLSAVDID